MNAFLKTRNFFARKHLSLLYFLLICFISGNLVSCGGGGGSKINKSIIVNTIGLKKKYIEQSSNIVREKYDLLHQNGNEKCVFYKTIENKKFVNPYPFVWDEQKYFLSCWLGGNLWSGGVGIFDSKGRLMTFLETPRYCTGAIAMPITIKGQNDSLAVFILQQATSRSSTLFLLNSGWDIIYKEYLGKGKCLGKSLTKNKGFLLIEEAPDRKNEIEWIYF